MRKPSHKPATPLIDPRTGLRYSRGNGESLSYFSSSSTSATPSPSPLLEKTSDKALRIFIAAGSLKNEIPQANCY